MVHLIRKDFVAGGLFLLGLGGLWVFQGLVLFRFDLLVLLSGLIVLLLPITFFAVDARYNADLLGCSLPVLRSTMVYARYLSALVLTVAGLIVTVLLGMAFRALFSMGGGDVSIIMTGAGAVGFVGSILLLHAVFFPFVFRSGLSRGTGHFCVAVMLVVAVLAGVEVLISLRHGYALFEEAPFIGLNGVLHTWASALGAGRFRAMMAILTVGVVLASVRLSVRFYGKRDL